MTDKTMTLEQAIPLVDGIMNKHPKGVLVRDAWDAITRHISQTAERGEAVAEVVDAESDDGYLIPKHAKLLTEAARKLPAGTTLYTAAPPAAGVSDGLYEVAKRNLRSLIINGSDDKELMLKCLDVLSATPSPAIGDAK